MVEFIVGGTSSSHPVACAAVFATLNFYKEENLFERAGELGKVLGDAMHSALKGLPTVIGIRKRGLAGAVELSGIAYLPSNSFPD